MDTAMPRDMEAEHEPVFSKPVTRRRALFMGAVLVAGAAIPSAMLRPVPLPQHPSAGADRRSERMPI